jgi:hypothetical protein
VILTEPDSIGSHFDRIADLLVVVGPLAVWFFRWTRRIEGSYTVAKDITKNHLPFIYRRLHVHDARMALESPEHPNIVLVPNGSK